MKKVSPLVPLAEVLKPICRPQSVDPEKSYRILGAHWYAEGLYVKDTLPGSQIRADKVFSVEEGDFVYNRLFAWKGSFAVATAANAGCYVSNEFPCFVVNPDKADANFLWRYFSRVSAWEEALGLSTGGTPTSRNRLKEEKFLAMEIPLPPLIEQRRIVARIEELASKINEARTLRINTVNEMDAIMRSVVTRIDQYLRTKHSVAELEDFASGQRGALRSGPFGSALLHSEFVIEGIPAIGIQDVQENRFELTRRWNVTPEKAEELRRYTIKPRDILVTVMGTLGRACVVPDDIPRMVSTKHVWTVTIDQTRAEPKWVSYWLNFSSLVRDDLLGQGTGTAIPGLNGEKIRALFLPDIPLLDQQNIVAELDALQAQVDALKKLQAETAAELDALLPSILDKAFKWQL
jgi:type I restriction enzyme S subunit